MAHALVYIELSGQRPREASLEALGVARRLATRLGATLYAALPMGPTAGTPEALIDELSHGGADRVVLLSTAQHNGPPSWVTCGAALAAACDRLLPRLVVAAATHAGRDIAPRLATRLKALYVPEAALVEIDRNVGRAVGVERPTAGGGVRRVHPDLVVRPVVLTVAPGSYAPTVADDEAEVLPIAVPERPSGAAPLVAEVQDTADPDAGIDTAQVLVVAGASVGSAGLQSTAELAMSLGGELAVTAAACEAGLAPSGRALGPGRPVHPRLLIRCGVDDETAALAPTSGALTATVVALEGRAETASVRLAGHALVGDTGEVTQTLTSALRGVAR
jgi:electron transfer flavoprotein alpha subunit